MNVTVERIADVLECYAACLRSAEAGAVRLERRVDQLQIDAGGAQRVHLFLADLHTAPAQYAPAELVELINDLRGRDHDERGGEIPLTAIEALLDTLRAIALVERTSLGSPAAVRLRSRTTAEELAWVWARWQTLDPRRSKRPENISDASEPSPSALWEAAAEIVALYEQVNVHQEHDRQETTLTRTPSGDVRRIRVLLQVPTPLDEEPAELPLSPEVKHRACYVHRMSTDSSFDEVLALPAPVLSWSQLRILVVYATHAKPQFIEGDRSPRVELLKAIEALCRETTDQRTPLELRAQLRELRNEVGLSRAAHLLVHTDQATIPALTTRASATTSLSDDIHAVLQLLRHPTHTPRSNTKRVLHDSLGGASDLSASERSTYVYFVDQLPRGQLLLDEPDLQPQKSGLRGHTDRPSSYLLTPVDHEAPQRAMRLRELGLGQGPDRDFDAFARELAEAAQALSGADKAPFAMVNFVADRQYLDGLYAPPSPDSAVQLAREVSLHHGYCPHVVVRRKVLVLDDVCAYTRFADNPVVDKLGVRSYIGAPLIDRTGVALGTICVVDTKPRPWGYPGLNFIKEQAEQLMKIIHRRKGTVDQLVNPLRERPIA